MAQTRPWNTRKCEYLCILSGKSPVWTADLSLYALLLTFFVQVHKLENSTWQNVSVVPIDIADRSQVSPAVSRKTLLAHFQCKRNIVWRPHVDKPDHYQAILQTQSMIHKEWFLTSINIIIYFTFGHTVNKKILYRQEFLHFKNKRFYIDFELEKHAYHHTREVWVYKCLKFLFDKFLQVSNI